MSDKEPTADIWTVEEWDQAFILKDGNGNFIENFYDKDKPHAHQIVREHNALAEAIPLLHDVLSMHQCVCVTGLCYLCRILFFIEKLEKPCQKNPPQTDQ